MTFRVGQKVVCVALPKATTWWAWLERKLRPFPGEMPVVGRVYEIENITPYGSLELRGLYSPADDYWDAGFIPSLFRPIVERKTDISCLKALLVPGAKIRETA